ncbi:MAG: peptidoglycan D,D-transpeptidase FtsI family protein [Myxococcota bacterium]|jgi:cell division protein FtsI/penicillin-binding protein 2|nr:penicillin-binding protein 2 [Myxococcota bacterium]HON24598.1 penicillin-binding protein 2 [Myxococcota bacterium]HOS61143.1 penicillin-binding protein 2 [Myxococcota bacterium]HPC91066.1 penicillin-binding protein 2 [Myxococcota bacterium]HPL24571.1 penicillin-binding protein 2 [Myxococcota bacterium]
MMGVREKFRRLGRWIAGSNSQTEAEILHRMVGVTAFALAALVFFVIKFGALQKNEIEARATQHAHATKRAKTIVGRRGDIYDRTGSKILATTSLEPAVVLRGVPAYFDRKSAAYQLAVPLDMDPERLQKSFQTTSENILIKERLTEQEVSAVEKLGISGISIEHHYHRFYPLENLLGSVLGYLSVVTSEEVAPVIEVLDLNSEPELAKWIPLVDSLRAITGYDATPQKVTRKYQPDTYLARKGIELSYDDVLRGRSKRLGQVSDSRGRLFPLGSAEDVLLTAGDSILLSVDVDIQMVLDEQIEAHVKAQAARGGMGVILDAKTGDILAMSSYPFLDPNNFKAACGATSGQVDDGSNACRNKVVEFPFEPGSIAKMVTAMIGFDIGAFEPGTRLPGVGSPCFVGRNKVRDTHGLKKGEEYTVSSAFRHSSNCAFAELGGRIGGKRFLQGLIRLGVGAKTGIDLPGERIGRAITSRTRMTEIDAKAAGYGYGYYTSIINMALLTAAVTMDGVKPIPQLVIGKRSHDSDNLEIIPRPKPQRVISKRAARQVKQLMVDAIMWEPEKGRAYHPARPKLYSAAGKTGTARINLGGNYTQKAYNTSFVGFAPAEEPEIVVALTLIDPQKNKLAAQAVGPVFRAVVDRVLPIRGIEAVELEEAHAQR